MIKNEIIPRIMIAGTNSGCGKTTVTCAILRALSKRGNTLSAFKCGPDFIDPMFHSKILGATTANLDIFMLGENTCKALLANNAQHSDLSIIEGVMGFYDGLGGTTEFASANHLSNATQTPVVLVVNGRGTSLSIVATIQGFLAFSPNNIKAVIINGVTEKTYEMMKEAIEKRLPILVVGFLPNLPKAAIESRHLGLVTANEIVNIEEKLDLLAENAEKFIDIQAIIDIANNAEPLEFEQINIEKIVENKTIAVAFDSAFCFYYKDSFKLLEQLGAKILYFSPLKDEHLPPNINGLILGGGYPENYLTELSANKTMLADIKKALENGLPTIAECGGFMYLHKEIDGLPMVGAIKGGAFMTKKLTRFGYVTLTAQTDNLLCKRGETINAHEFHYSDSANCGDAFVATKPTSGVSWNCIHATETLFAGYPHLHLWANLQFATNFVNKL